MHTLIRHRNFTHHPEQVAPVVTAAHSGVGQHNNDGLNDVSAFSLSALMVTAVLLVLVVRAVGKTLVMVTEMIRLLVTTSLVTLLLLVTCLVLAIHALGRQ